MALKKKLNGAAMAAEINSDVNSNAATETVVKEPVKAKPVKKMEGSLADLLTPKRTELKTESLTLRIKPSTKIKFEEFCAKKGVSRADMFEYWVNNITD